MIRNLIIRNFKSCRDVQVDLERFTMFVGPNGSGKSSILQSLDFLCRAFQPEPTLNENVLLQNQSRGVSDAIDLVCEFDSRFYRYRPKSPSTQTVPQRRPAQQWLGYGPGFAEAADTADWKQWHVDRDNPPPLPHSVLLHLETSKLIQPVHASDPTILAPDGSGLHAVLANVRLNEPSLWERLQSDFKEIIPTIHQVRHTKANNNRPAALLFDTVGAESLTAEQVSEGTLHVLGLLTALHSAGDRAVVMLDDVDQGLHPKAQRELISFLRKLLETKPDLQLLATTHSPYMLDNMEPNEVRMTFLRDDGTTACGALVDHPDFEKWKEEMTPGEMWSLFGENWIVDSSRNELQPALRIGGEQEGNG